MNLNALPIELRLIILQKYLSIVRNRALHLIDIIDHSGFLSGVKDASSITDMFLVKRRHLLQTIHELKSLEDLTIISKEAKEFSKYLNNIQTVGWKLEKHQASASILYIELLNKFVMYMQSSQVDLIPQKSELRQFTCEEVQDIAFNLLLTAEI